MAKARILVADNDAEYLDTILRFLTAEGFKVLAAYNPVEARRLLDQGDIDLAVIDLRLQDNKNERDLSGLKLVKQDATPIPKILLTAYPRMEDVREALGPQMEGLPPAVSFVAKQEGVEALLEAIKSTLRFVPRYRQMSDNLTARITQDYKDARQQAVWSFWSSLAISIVGAIIIFLGAYLAILGLLAVAVPSTIAGVITEAVGFLFFNRSNAANNRVDSRYQDLISNWWMDKLMAACDELPGDAAEGECKQRVIETGARIMLGNRGDSKTLARRESEVR